MKPHRLSHVAASIALILILILPGGAAAALLGGEAAPAAGQPMSLPNQSSFLTSFPIGGAALHVAVQNSNSIWFTLPGQDAIGRLMLPQNGSPGVEVQILLPSGSRPYDIVFDAGAAWFTEEGSGRIGRIDPVNGSLLEFTIPVSPTLAKPHGIQVLQGSSPAQVWFTESGTDRIGKLVYAGPENAQITEYALPAGWDDVNGLDWSHAHPEGLAIYQQGFVFFTVPDAPVPLLAAFLDLNPPCSPLAWCFDAHPMNDMPGRKPWRIVKGTVQDVWIVDRGRSSIFRFAPSTMTAGFDYYTPTANSHPQDLVLVGGSSAFVAETAAGVLGRAFNLPEPTGFFEMTVADSEPVGLAADGSTGCVWASDAAQPRLLRWCPPYFDISRRAYLPSLARSRP